MHPPHASPARTCMSPLNSSASLSTRESSWYPSHLALAARTRRGWRAHKNSTRAPWSTDEPSMARSRIIRSACSARAALCQRGNQRQTEDAIRRCNQEASNGEQKMQSEDAIRRCNQKMQSEDAIRRCNQEASKAIRRCNQKMQSEDAIRRCNQEASNGEQKMQSEDVIRRCNQEASNGEQKMQSEDAIRRCNQKMQSRGK